MYTSEEELKEKFGDSFWMARFEWDYKARKPYLVQKPIHVILVEYNIERFNKPYIQAYELKSNGKNGKRLDSVGANYTHYFKSEEECENWFKEKVKCQLERRMQFIQDVLHREFEDHVKRYLGE